MSFHTHCIQDLSSKSKLKNKNTLEMGQTKASGILLFSISADVVSNDLIFF
jgi:hypothetical protein